MTVTHLTSKNHSIIKTIRLIASHSRRAPKELVFAEGIRVLEEAARAGCDIKAALFSESFGETSRERELLDTIARRNIRGYRAKDSILQSVSEVRASQGALALVHVPALNLDAVRHVCNPLILCACGIQDPGNLGTLIRTALAAGATAVCTTPGTVWARSPKTLRASAGALFHIPLIENVPPGDFLEYCRTLRIRPYRTEMQAGALYTDIDFRGSVALLLGNEGHGLPRQWEGLQCIQIPMALAVQSLNVAVAGAIILFEAHKQRSKCG